LQEEDALIDFLRIKDIIKVMERERKAPLTSLMRPALREGYLAIQKVFEENEYKPTQKIKYFRNGSVRSIKFNGLTREIVEKIEDAAWGVKIARDEKNLDEQKDILGFSCYIPIRGSLTNSAYFSIS
jgi:hypothetical protein